MNAGRLDTAQKHLYASIALSPSRPVAWGDLGLIFAKQGQQDKAVAAMLIGYQVSKGETLGFLKSLDKDNDSNVRDAGNLALSKLNLSNSPDAVVRNLYEMEVREQSPFTSDDRTHLDKYFDKPLADLIWKNMERDTLGSDPLTNAQNLDSPSFKLGAPEIAQDSATVDVDFKNFGKTASMTVHLRNACGAWKVSDIDYGGGVDLLKSLQ